MTSADIWPRSSDPRRTWRIKLRRALAADRSLFRVSPRLADCGSRPVSDCIVIRKTAAGRSYLAGLSSCGLVHQCPWCGPKIRHGRTVEILECFAAVKAMGGAAHLLTLTLPHDLPDPLPKLLRALDAGWKKIPNGANWTRLGNQIGYLGYYYAEEILCSCEAGEWAALTVYARRQWQAGVVSEGVRRPHDIHGVDLAPNVTDDDVARYVTKVQEGAEPSGWTPAHELARGDVKDGRGGSLVPFMLAATFLHTGDLEYLHRWRQYVAATKGRPAIRSSRGLRKRLGLGAAATDAVLAAAEVDGSSDVGGLSCPVWARVLAARIETKLLDESDRGGLAAVNDLLAAFGCGWANTPS